MSTMSEQRRRHSRISFCTSVVMRADGHRRPVHARARNVSEGGMFVSAQTAIAVGSELSCELMIDGARRSMRARVAWVRQQSSLDPAALGLEFCDVADAAALHSLVKAENPHGQRSRVWFDGVSDSIVGDTQLFECGAVLRAALPFLEVGRAIRLEVGQADRQVRTGRIASIALASDPDTHVPYLRVEFALESTTGSTDIDVIDEPASSDAGEETIWSTSSGDEHAEQEAADVAIEIENTSYEVQPASFQPLDLAEEAVWSTVSADEADEAADESAPGRWCEDIASISADVTDKVVPLPQRRVRRLPRPLLAAGAIIGVASALFALQVSTPKGDAQATTASAASAASARSTHGTARTVLPPPGKT